MMRCLASANAATYRLPATRLSGCKTSAPSQADVPSNEYSGLISFRIDWFDLLAVKETLKSLLQHHSLKQLLILGI